MTNIKDKNPEMIKTLKQSIEVVPKKLKRKIKHMIT
jgi:hypothetical protein